MLSLRILIEGLAVSCKKKSKVIPWIFVLRIWVTTIIPGLGGMEWEAILEGKSLIPFQPC